MSPGISGSDGNGSFALALMAESRIKKTAESRIRVIDGLLGVFDSIRHWKNRFVFSLNAALVRYPRETGLKPQA